MVASSKRKTKRAHRNRHAEKRHCRRVRFDGPALLELDADASDSGEAIEAEMRDLSPEGAGIAVRGPASLRTGDSVKLRFRLVDLSLALPARVVWTRGVDGSLAVGVRLLLARADRDAGSDYARSYLGLSQQAHHFGGSRP